MGTLSEPGLHLFCLSRVRDTQKASPAVVSITNSSHITRSLRQVVQHSPSYVLASLIYVSHECVGDGHRHVVKRENPLFVIPPLEEERTLSSQEVPTVGVGFTILN